MWQSLEIFNIFSTLTLKQVFWKTKALFKKLKYRFLVEYYDQKHDISIQFFSIKNQCSNKLNGVYKMDPSQRTEFCHYGQLWLGFVLANYLKFLKNASFMPSHPADPLAYFEKNIRRWANFLFYINQIFLIKHVLKFDWIVTYVNNL